MSQKNGRYAYRTAFTLLMLFSALAGLIFLVLNNLDFIIAALSNGKFHIPNMAYSISRILSGILLPFIFVAPSLFRFGRVKMTKILLTAYGILYALTLTWIFYFLAENPFADLFSIQKTVEFQSLPENSFVSSYVNWDTYTPIANVFTLIYSALCIYTGINFDDNRKRVRLCVMLIPILRIFLPIISGIFDSFRTVSAFWFTNNYADIISLVLFAAAIYVASADDARWISLVWDQDVVTENDITEF